MTDNDPYQVVDYDAYTLNTPERAIRVYVRSFVFMGIVYATYALLFWG